MKRLIVYDLDGTLVDTKEDITRAANHMLEKMAAPPLSREEVCRAVGNGVRQLVEGCLKTQDPIRVEEGIRIYRGYYAKHLLDHTALYPFVRETLEYFRKSKQLVVTNKPNPYSRDILAALGVADFFLEIIAGDSGYARKPDPSSVRAILKREGVSPAEALLVGDSPVDVETGRSAGIFTVGVTHGFGEEEELKRAAPDVIVRDFSQLLELAKRQRW